MKGRTLLLTCAFLISIAGAMAAQAPDTSQPAEATTTALASSSSEISVSGKVVSSTDTEVVIDSDAGPRLTFALDPNTSPATSFTAGERVTVRYHTATGGTVHQAASVVRDPQLPEVTTTEDSSLPNTASRLPLIGLLGLVALGGALVVRLKRS